MEARVVTYNILSSEFCTKFNKTPYTEDERIKLIQSHLDVYISDNYIICIQELSASMYGSMSLFFESKGYAMYNATAYAYGLGVAIAAPLGIVTRCCSIRLRDKKTWSRYENTWFQYVMKYMSLLYYSPPSYQSWRNASFKNVMMVCIEVKKKYCVSTIHMPCSYKEPFIMHLYLALARRAVNDFAGKIPYVLAGDFNIQPDSKLYAEMLSGEFDNFIYDEECPESDKWRPKNVQPLVSAHVVFNGTEPNYTNFTSMKTKNGTADGFCGTLDYILCTPNIHVISCDAQYSSSEPQPNISEPSDHVPVRAIFTVE